MIKLIKNINSVKDSNLVFVIETKSDLKFLNDLNLEKKIINKINNSIKEEKNLSLSFYI
jgi:hypothetical protein